MVIIAEYSECTPSHLKTYIQRFSHFKNEVKTRAVQFVSIFCVLNFNSVWMHSSIARMLQNI